MTKTDMATSASTKESTIKYASAIKSNESYEDKQHQKKLVNIGGRLRKTTHRTLQEHQVPPFHREPFITSGYRDTENITVRQCAITLFTIHNETFNIWSHIIAAVGMFVYAMSHILQHGIIGNPSVYPLLCFALACCAMLLSSSFAHLFCCMSWKARHTCFYIDYAFISVFTLASALGMIFYCRPISDQSSVLYSNPYLFISISTALSITLTFCCCISRHRFRKYRFLLRSGIALVKLLFDISPFWANCGVFGLSNICSPSIQHTFNRFMLFFLISGIINASRLPERLFPGHFDLFGHSHHFLHVLGVIGNYEAFNVMLMDMVQRKDALSNSTYQPTFLTTFGFLIILILANCVIVVWFVCNWLQTEEDELFSGSKYLVIYKKSSEANNNPSNGHKKKQ